MKNESIHWLCIWLYFVIPLRLGIGLEKCGLAAICRYRELIMKIILSVFLVILSLPAVAGLIRHDTPDSLYTEFAANPLFSAVGLIKFETPAGADACSGTVIHKNWVLTAGHCVSDSNAMTFSLPTSSGWQVYNADSWVAHENFSGANLYAGWDLGLMHISTDMEVDPISLYSGSSELFKTAYSVGYGWTGTGYTGASDYDSLRRAGTNSIDAIFSTEGSGEQILLADFDHPDDRSYNALMLDDRDTDDFATTLEIMASYGDSGGGLFFEENGKLFLAGVHSYVDDRDGDASWRYGDVFGSTRVSSFIDWISNKINPTLVPEPGALWLMLMGLATLAWQRSLGRRN